MRWKLKILYLVNIAQMQTSDALRYLLIMFFVPFSRFILKLIYEYLLVSMKKSKQIDMDLSIKERKYSESNPRLTMKKKYYNFNTPLNHFELSL